MREQIQQLIAGGKTEEALQLIKTIDATEAAVLQAQLTDGKSKYRMGILGFEAWSRILAQINYSMLELADKANTSPVNTAPQTNNATNDQQTVAPIALGSVFISYNHGDQAVVDRIEQFLEDNRIQVIRDVDDLRAGESIDAFIKRVMAEKGHILSVVSANSLSAGWVGVESDLSFYSEIFGGRNFIPVTLSGDIFSADFVYTVVEDIDKKLKAIEDDFKKRKKLNLNDDDLIPKRKRLQSLRQNLPKIISRLNEVKTVDIAGDNFEKGMQQVLKALS